MANTTDEEPADKPQNSASELPSEEITASGETEVTEPMALETEPTKPIPTSDTMEVHHHAHIHSKSKWKEYVFQFFMLFLAVFCGFLAEYQLEHKIEHDREEVYMHSMIEDLIADTLAIHDLEIRLDTTYIPYFDKSLPALYGGDTSDSAIILLYNVVPRCTRFLDINLENRTRTQLTNSGNLRLIRCQSVTDSLARYWRRCENLQDPILTGYAETRSKAKWAVHDLMNMGYFEDYSAMSPVRAGITPKLLDMDPNKRITLANHIANLRAQAMGPLSRSLAATKGAAKRLIDLIRKEYDMH